MDTLFDGFEEDHYQTVSYQTAQKTNDGHDRQEFRQLWVVTEADYLAFLPQGACWAKLTSLIKLVTVRVTPTKTETSTRYFIGSWLASAQAFMEAIREQWQIEHGLHWVLDIAFRGTDLPPVVVPG